MNSKNLRNLKVAATFAIFGQIAISPSLNAEEGDAGTYGGFLTYWGTSARNLGMAGAFTGLVDDASAGYFNPAGLVQLNTYEITFMHSIVFSGVGTRANVLTYGGPITPTSAIGATIFHINTSGIKRSTRERHGYTGEEFGNKEIAGLLTLCARLIGPTWIGVNAKAFQHSIYLWSGMGFGIDAGLFLFPDGPFSLGINVQNALKPSVKLIDEENTFPTVLRGGVSLRPWREKLALSFDAIWSEYREPKFGAGLEYRPWQLIHLRTGVNQSFLGMGFGVWKDQRTYEIKVDYAFQLPHKAAYVFGYGHSFSLSLMFGGYRSKSYCPVIAFSPTLGEEAKNIAWLNFNLRPRTKTERWEVAIKDEKGAVVKKIGATGEPPHRISWDGTDENSLLVPDGNYYYTFKVIEIGGKVWTYEGFLSYMYWVPPEATTTIRAKRKKPIHVMEEERTLEEKKKAEKRRRKFK